MANYRMTPARHRALQKAQAASARKRRGKGKGKLAAANRRATRNKRIAIGTGLAAGAAIGAVAYSNSTTGRRHRSARSELRLENSYHGSLGSRGNIQRFRTINKDFKRTSKKKTRYRRGN